MTRHCDAVAYATGGLAMANGMAIRGKAPPPQPLMVM